MGYTTYYRQKRDMTDEEFTGFCEDVKKLHEALPATVGDFVERYGPTAGSSDGDEQLPLAIVSQGLVGAGKSIFGKGVVGFNGAGYADADHETFWLPQKIANGAQKWEMEDVAKGNRFHFTKTARKPYDVMVCACLLALKKRAASAWEISSDGNVADWASSYRFAKSALGTKVLPLSKIGSFKKDAEELSKAQSPTPWMLAQQERRDLERQSQAKPKPARARGL